MSVSGTDPGSPRPPLPMDAIPTMYHTPAGPPEHSDEHAALEDTKGFRYRTLLGELLYAYVTCRCDIGYSVTTLSKFANSPAADRISKTPRIFVLGVTDEAMISIVLYWIE